MAGGRSGRVGNLSFRYNKVYFEPRPELQCIIEVIICRVVIAAECSRDLHLLMRPAMSHLAGG